MQRRDRAMENHGKRALCTATAFVAMPPRRNFRPLRIVSADWDGDLHLGRACQAHMVITRITAATKKPTKTRRKTATKNCCRMFALHAELLHR